MCNIVDKIKKETWLFNRNYYLFHGIVEIVLIKTNVEHNV